MRIRRATEPRWSCGPCVSASHSHPTTLDSRLKRLTDHLFTFFPELLGGVWIKCISAYSFADCGNGCAVGDNISDVAIFAISTTDFVRGSNDSGPHRSCRPLRDGLRLEGWLALRRKLLVDLVDYGLQTARICVATELCLYGSRM